MDANHFVFGEQAAGGGVCAKPKIDELLRVHKMKAKGGKSQNGDAKSPSLKRQ